MPPRTTEITDLTCYHHFCRAIPYSRGAQKAVDILRAQGATFRHYGKPMTELKSSRAPDDSVRQESGAVLGEDGSILGGPDIQHRLLVPERTVGVTPYGLPEGADAFGTFSFFADSPAVVIRQRADYRDSTPVDMLATGLLALATHLYPALRPMYGWVDEAGWNTPTGKALASPNPRYLFWANFFGPERVEAIGREFLKGAPGWVSVDLGDGGILLVATESYQEWWQNDQPDLLTHFRRKFPKVQIYRAQPIPY